jgi:hypothetical protein
MALNTFHVPIPIAVFQMTKHVVVAKKRLAPPWFAIGVTSKLGMLLTRRVPGELASRLPIMSIAVQRDTIATSST